MRPFRLLLAVLVLTACGGDPAPSPDAAPDAVTVDTAPAPDVVDAVAPADAPREAAVDAPDVVVADAGADAAEVAQHDHWRGQIDALQVDLYDHEAASPVLDSAEFYADCRKLLTEDGCMTVNLFGRSSSYEQSLTKMAKAFGIEALWAFKPTREGNTVVLAQRTPRHPKRAELMARAEVIQARWPLPATKWLRVFKPLQAP